VRRPFPSKETQRISERDDPGPDVVPGGQGIGLGERVCDWGGPRRSWSSCVLPKSVPQGQKESGGIVLAAICWAPIAQRRCHPEEALYLPTFTHSLIVNKLLSLSHTHSPMLIREHYTPALLLALWHAFRQRTRGTRPSPVRHNHRPALSRVRDPKPIP
jgi:hypothetical protein